MVYLLLRPSTMEDEGRHHLIAAYRTEEEAIAERDRQVAASQGWYSKGSFSIAKEVA